MTNYILPFFLLFSMLSCGSFNKQEKIEETEINKYEYSMIYALLERGVSGKKVATDLSEYQLEFKGPLSRTENRWMFTHEKDKESAVVILEAIKKHPSVLEAQFALLPNGKN